MKRSQLRVCAVGAGYFAPFHLDAWRRLEGAELVALADLDDEKRERVSRRFDIEKQYADVATMLDEERPEVLDIITPPASHRALCALAFDRGVDVICQKPLAPTVTEAEEMVAMAKASGRRLIVHENWRFQPWYQRSHALLKGGQIGERIHHLAFRMRMGDGWPEDAYLARQPYFRDMPRLLMHETGIHFIDTIRFLAGEITSVYARLQRHHSAIAGEDAALVIFNLEGGGTALLDANRYNEAATEDPRYTFGTMLLETEGGSLRLDTEGGLQWQALGKPPAPVDYVHERRNFAGDCVYMAQKHFLAALRTGEEAETEAAGYLRNLKVLEAVYKSGSENRTVAVVYD